VVPTPGSAAARQVEAARRRGGGARDLPRWPLRARGAHGDLPGVRPG
jgi:hypothetical protein